jgi:ribosomal protein S18 acetylase RimI-like enzyme
VIRFLDISSPELALKVHKLQKLSYAVEALLIGSFDIPPLLETLEDLQNSGETFYGFFKEDILAGVIAYKADEEILDIYRVMVHPDYFRQGIARAMLEFVEKQFLETPETQCPRIIVATGSLNTPAKGLYESLGFKVSSEHEVEAGLKITTFEKIRAKTF